MQTPSIPSHLTNPLAPRLPAEPEPSSPVGSARDPWSVHDGQFFASQVRSGQAKSPNERRLLSQLGGNADSSSTGPGLIAACEASSMPRIRALLREGADINCRDPKGWTPLMYASSLGHKMAVVELLQRGADHSLRQSQGCTALMLASMANQLPIVELLLEAHADPHAADSHGVTALAYASLWGHEAVIRRLLQAGARPTTRSRQRDTTLSFEPASPSSRRAGVVATLHVHERRPKRSPAGRSKRGKLGG